MFSAPSPVVNGGSHCSGDRGCDRSGSGSDSDHRGSSGDNGSGSDSDHRGSSGDNGSDSDGSDISGGDGSNDGRDGSTYAWLCTVSDDRNVRPAYIIRFELDKDGSHTQKCVMCAEEAVLYCR
jgi:hypothetical protein